MICHIKYFNFSNPLNIHPSYYLSYYHSLHILDKIYPGYIFTFLFLPRHLILTLDSFFSYFSMTIIYLPQKIYKYWIILLRANITLHTIFFPFQCSFDSKPSAIIFYVTLLASNIQNLNPYICINYTISCYVNYGSYDNYHTSLKIWEILLIKFLLSYHLSITYNPILDSSLFRYYPFLTFIWNFISFPSLIITLVLRIYLYFF